MSAARRFVLVLALTVATVAVSAASVFAQGSSPNPSGGTWLRPATEEGSGSVGLGDYLSSGYSFGLGLRAWLSSYAASRFIAPAATRPASGRTMLAAFHRRVWER